MIKVSNSFNRKLGILLRTAFPVLFIGILLYYDVLLLRYVPSYVWIGVLLLVIYICSVIFFVEVFYSEDGIKIKANSIASFNDVIQIKQRNYNFIQRVFWAESADRIFAPAPDLFSITFLINGVETSKHFFIGIETKESFLQFIAYAKERNPRLELLIK